MEIKPIPYLNEYINCFYRKYRKFTSTKELEVKNIGSLKSYQTLFLGNCVTIKALVKKEDSSLSIHFSNYLVFCFRLADNKPVILSIVKLYRHHPCLRFKLCGKLTDKNRSPRPFENF